MNADLRTGAVEGAFRVSPPDRGGVVESGPIVERAAMLDPIYYGNQAAAPGEMIPPDDVLKAKLRQAGVSF